MSGYAVLKKRLVAINVIVLFLLILNSLESEMNNPMYVDFNELNNKAELVLFCELEQVPPPFYILGTAFYKIIPGAVLKGNWEEKSLLSIYFAYNSLWSPPLPAGQKPYLLFLKRGKMDDGKAPEDIYYYEPVNTWQGMVPLFAIEGVCPGNRLFQVIKNNYDIEIASMLPDFITAIKEAYAKSDTELTGNAARIYETLKLDLIKKGEKEALQLPDQEKW